MIMRTKYSLLTITFLLLGLGLFAGNTSLKGTITEEIEGRKQGIPFANVAVIELMQGSTTDFDGNFTIENLNPGTFHLVVSFMGYKPDTVEVVLNPGSNTLENVVLKKNSQLLKEFEVTAKVNRESENILLMEQREANEIKQSIGAQELSRKGVSNVASGLTKVTGVTMVEGRDMFVRGLGDRYNMATFNGALMASPNPDLKVIPLDLIPTDIVQSLSIDKVFVPRYFADYAGAKIDIVTKDYPETPFFKMELSTSINSISTFKDFKTDPTVTVNTLDLMGTLGTYLLSWKNMLLIMVTKAQKLKNKIILIQLA